MIPPRTGTRVDAYIPLVEFLGKAMGDRCEVVLHDLATPENSIVAIANGHISGRKVGGPVTDFLLRVLKRKEQEHVPYLANYRGKGRLGICRSSSYFIENAEGETVGVLCINVDITGYLRAKEFLEKELVMADFMKDGMPWKPVVPALGSEEEIGELGQEHVMESFHGSLEDVITQMIDAHVSLYNVSTERFSLEERMQIVRDLNADGLFLLRGGISALAQRMGVSEPTMYRYVSKVRKEGNGK